MAQLENEAAGCRNGSAYLKRTHRRTLNGKYYRTLGSFFHGLLRLFALRAQADRMSAIHSKFQLRL
jgi:hypothetical protein